MRPNFVPRLALVTLLISSPTFAQALKSDLQIELEKIDGELQGRVAYYSNQTTDTTRQLMSTTTVPDPANPGKRIAGNPYRPINQRNPDSPSLIEHTLDAQAHRDANLQVQSTIKLFLNNLAARKNALLRAPEEQQATSRMPATFSEGAEAYKKQAGDVLLTKRDLSRKALRDFENIYETEKAKNEDLAVNKMMQLSKDYATAQTDLLRAEEKQELYARLSVFNPTGGHIVTGTAIAGADGGSGRGRGGGEIVVTTKPK